MRIHNKIICNQCGREIRTVNGEPREGLFSGDIVFGYFSRKDGTRHRFDLCEDCYDAFVAGFRIPAEETEPTELI